MKGFKFNDEIKTEENSKNKNIILILIFLITYIQKDLKMFEKNFNYKIHQFLMIKT